MTAINVIFSIFAIIMGSLGAGLTFIVAMMIIGNQLHRHRYPQDAILNDRAMKALKARTNFEIENTYRLKATDGIYSIDEMGSLSVGNQSVRQSWLQESRMSRQVKRIWKERGRHSAIKAQLIERTEA